MKKFKFLGIAAIAISFSLGVTIWNNNHYLDGISGLLLENIEALAAGEGSGGYSFDCWDQENAGRCILYCTHCGEQIEIKKGHTGGAHNISGKCPFCHSILP